MLTTFTYTLPLYSSAYLLHQQTDQLSVNMAALLILTVFSCLACPAFGRWSAQESASLMSEHLVGAPGEMSKKELHSEPVQEAARFAVDQLNLNAQPGSAANVLVGVTSGTSQVVSGVRYRLVLEIGQSLWCRLNKDRKIPAKNCPVDNSTVKTWKADVWVQPWLSPQYKLLDLQQVHRFSH